MDEHNFLLKNGDVLNGPLKIETDKITHDLDLINKDYFDKNQFVHTGDTPPVDPPFGAIFVHEDTLKEFIYVENNGKPIWVETSGCGVDLDGKYVLKIGDQMSGPIKILNTNKITDPDHLVYKGYVDNQVREVEEELEAISPTLTSGVYRSTAATGNPQVDHQLSEGEFGLYEGVTKTIDYTNQGINLVILSKTDVSGTVRDHQFNVPGDLLQLLDRPDTDYGIFKILAKNDNDPDFIEYEVEHVEGVGECTTLEESRLRIFKQLVGGEAEDFVRIDGTSTMTGELKIDNPLLIQSDNAYITKGLSLPRDLSTLPDINQP